MEPTSTTAVTGLHNKILSVVREDLTVKLTRRGVPVVDRSDSELLSAMFYNYRYIKHSKQHQGIRLTVLGNQLLRKHYVAYDFEIQNKVSHKALLTLDKNMTWPYYIGKTWVTFYSENDAAWFSLNGNSLDDFVDYI